MSTRFRLYIGLVLAAFGALAQEAGTAIVVGMVHDSRGYQAAGVGGRADVRSSRRKAGETGDGEEIGL